MHIYYSYCIEGRLAYMPSLLMTAVRAANLEGNIWNRRAPTTFTLSSSYCWDGRTSFANRCWGEKRNSGVSIILITFGIEGFSSSSYFSPNLTFGLIEHDPLLRFWRERPPAARFSVSTSQPSSSLAYSRFINHEIKIIITWSIPIPSTSINLHHSSGCCDCFWVNWGLPDHQQIFSRTICASNVNHEDGSCSQALDQS